MGFPPGMLLNTIAFGIPLTATGKDVVTTVSVKPTSRVIWAATGQPLPEFTDSFTAEAGQLGQFQVPAIDQPGFIDSSGNAVTDWAYQITASWQYGNERPIPWSKNLKPLMAQSATIDLDLVPDGPVTIPVTAPTAAMLGFNGRTGFVTLQESDLPSRLSPGELSATILDQTSGKLDSSVAATTYAAKSTQTTVETGRLSSSNVDANVNAVAVPAAQTAAANYLASNPGVVDAANTAVNNKVNGLSLITYGTAIGTAHLDTLTTPGQYTQGTTGNVTTAQGYPVAGEPVIVEVLSMGGETRMQRVTPVWGASQGRVIWQRVRVNVATGWETTWNAIAAQKIDTALGKFETWDDQRKRWQISPTSDTGWRNISSTLENGWTASEILVRRFGYRVSLMMRNVQAGTAATIVTLPTGFAPRSGGVVLASMTDSPSWTLRVTVADTGVVSVPLTSTVPDIRQEWSWSTLQAWPTALPGSASGSIPNA